MTTPIVDDYFKTYIAKPNGEGSASAVGVVGFTSNYCPVPQGVSTVQISWSGRTEIQIYYTPQGKTTAGGFRVGTLPAADETTSTMVVIPSSVTTGHIWMSVRDTVAFDVNKEIAITVTTFSTD